MNTGTQADYLDGVNIARLRECLTFLGCASDGMEAMAASLPEFVNRLTLAVERSRDMLAATPNGSPQRMTPAVPSPEGALSEHDQILAQLDDVICPRCHGDGTIPAMSNGGPDAHEVEVCCDHCDGKGTAGAAYAALAEYKQRARTELIQLRYYVDHHKLTMTPSLAEGELASELVELDAIERRLRASVNWLANGQLGGGLGIGLAELRWFQKHLPRLRVALAGRPAPAEGDAPAPCNCPNIGHCDGSCAPYVQSAPVDPTERARFEAEFAHLKKYPDISAETWNYMWFAWEARAASKVQPKGMPDGYKLLEDGKTMIPEGWTPLRLEWEPGYPEDVAFGPQRMMGRLKKWLDRYFAARVAAAAAQAPAPAPDDCEPSDKVRIAMLEALVADRDKSLRKLREPVPGSIWMYDFMDGDRPIRDWSTTDKDVAFQAGHFNQRRYVPEQAAQAPAVKADDARDAARYRALREERFSFSPRITDPTNDWLGYTAEGLDRVCDEMIALSSESQPPVQPTGDA